MGGECGKFKFIDSATEVGDLGYFAKSAVVAETAVVDTPSHGSERICGFRRSSCGTVGQSTDKRCYAVKSNSITVVRDNSITFLRV